MGHITAENLQRFEAFSWAATNTLKSRTRTTFILYVSATHSAISGALVIENETIRDGKIVK
jgi:hypothetical protein